MRNTGRALFQPLSSLSKLLVTFPSFSGVVFGSLAFEKNPSRDLHFRAMLRSVLEQKTHFSPLVSDHRAAIADLGISDSKILLFNMMMRCREKIVDGKLIYNNGFGLKETKEQYQERIGTVTREIIKMLEKHPEVTVIALQEAPIEEEDLNVMAELIDKFLPGWHAAQFELTDFGVMTFIRTEDKKNKFHVDSKLAEALEKERKKLSTRCQTFTNDTRYKISNIHVEHAETTESLRAILKALIDDAVANKINCHDIAGDFNSNFEQVKTVLEEVWMAKCRELKEHHPALKLEARFDASFKGHRKANGSEIDADGILSLTFGSASGKDDEFSFKNERLHYLAALIFGVITTVTSVLISSEMRINSQFGVIAGLRGFGGLEFFAIKTPISSALDVSQSSAGHTIS